MSNEPKYELNVPYKWVGFVGATTVREFKVVEDHGNGTVTVEVIRALDPQFNGERLIWNASSVVNAEKVEK